MTDSFKTKTIHRRWCSLIVRDGVRGIQFVVGIDSCIRDRVAMDAGAVDVRDMPVGAVAHGLPVRVNALIHQEEVVQ